MKKQMKGTRPAGRQNKRKMILDAAVEVFASKGAQLATIADVAKKARVALGTVYVYFTSKDDLLQQCMKEIIDTEIKSIITDTQSISDPMDRLTAFFRHHVELLNNKPYIARFLTVEARQSESFIMRNPGYNPLNQYVNYVRDITSQAIAQKQIKAINPDAMAYLLVGAMDIVLWQWIATDHQLSIDPIITDIRQILHEGTILRPQA